MEKTKVSWFVRTGSAVALGVALGAAPLGISHQDHSIALNSATAKGGDHGGGGGGGGGGSGGGSDGDHGGGKGSDNAGGNGHGAGGSSAGWRWPKR